MRSCAVLPTLVLLVAPALTAQQEAPRDRRLVVTLNPIATVAGFFTGDIERRISPSVTLGIGGSATLIDDFDGYGALDAKIRYYPNERALEGFSVTGLVGFASRKGYRNTIGAQFSTYERDTRATFGTEISYQWLLGPRKRFVLVLGGGAKRVLGARNYNEIFNEPFVPTGRANIGFAF